MVGHLMDWTSGQDVTPVPENRHIRYNQPIEGLMTDCLKSLSDALKNS